MAKNKKKIAVVATTRQEEALRMAIGVTLMDDKVDVYVLDKQVEDNERNALNLQTIKEMKIQVFTNCKDNKDMKLLSAKEIALKLTEYDHILPY
ncbi:MAG: hypothetical protein HY756_08455 [Nitrospirae bacterium]|nr:hypothetical protein [Nitrospirota bacterium]